MSIYDFNVKTIDGQEISMSKYKGKVLLIVNVAVSVDLQVNMKVQKNFLKNIKMKIL